MSTPPSYMQSLLNLYKGANAGGTQGAQGVLSGLSGLGKVGSTALGPGSDYQSQVQSAGNAAGGAGNALGIYNGVNQGGVTGYGGAAINAANLAGRTGALPTSVAKPVGNTANDLSSILGIYSGIKQGGVSGDASAAVNAAKLGSNLGAFGGASSAVGTAAGYAAAPLSLYNEINSWQSGATGSDALSGAETGAAIGSIVPGIGTVIGGLVGGAAGALSSVFGNGKVDPENQNFEGYTQAYNKAAASDPSQAGQLAASMQNPYLPLAGYFDLRANQVKGQNPIYQTYGRMGEQKFTNDLVSQVQSAQKANPNESAQDIYNQQVQPWLNSMGTWQDTNKAAMTDLIKNMTGQIANGTYQQDFKATGGDSPFAQTKADGGSVRHYAQGGGVQRYDNGGGVWDSGVGDGEVTVGGSGGGDEFDWSAYDPSSGFSTPDITTANPYSGGIDNVDELASVQNALGSNPGLLSQLSSMSAGQLAALGLGGLGGVLAGLNSQPNMTANYKPTPPQMFSNTGPVAPGQSQYGNFSSTPRTQTNPNINYATQAQTGGVPSFFTPSQPSAPSPLATGLPATPASPAAPQPAPVASGTPTPSTSGLVGASASGPGMTLQQPQQQIPAPIQNAQMINQLYGNNGMSLGVGPRNPNRTGRLAEGGQLHSDGISPIQAGMGLAAGVHVKGPGDGTSDEIPAVLSDGEYVIPAHVVSALGNGSNDAGAKALDALQENVRLHVGKQMAQGKHPRRIGNPEKYLK